MNIVERATKPSPLDRRHRSQALCDSADAAIAKGDLELAQRLLIQADIDDPRNPYPEERLSWLDREIDRFEALKGSTRPDGRKFDFLYAPTLRGLSTELSSLLPLHPDVFSVPKHELDHAIATQGEAGLLVKYQQQVLNSHNNLRGGLVQHAFIAGQRAGPEVAERLASITTRKLFMHGVRDPVRLAISDFNHELIARYGGAYYFWPLYPKTPFGWHRYILVASGPIYDHPHTRRQRKNYWRGPTQHYPRAVVTARAAGKLPERLFMHGLSRFSIQSKLIDERLADALFRARHFAVGETYARHFDSWIPIDLERPASAGESVVGRVFNAIGVDGQYDHPAFHASEGTTVHRLMIQNWIAVEIFGHLLHLGLGYADRTMFSNTFPHSEMLPFNPDDRFLDLGFSRQPLCVTVERAQWRLLPRDVRIRLVEFGGDSEISQWCARSAWLDSYKRWKSMMAKYLLRDLEPPVLSRLQAEIGPDLERFLKHHPQFEKYGRRRAILSVIDSAAATKGRIERTQPQRASLTCRNVDSPKTNNIVQLPRASAPA